jgi:hypothetical protein
VCNGIELTLQYTVKHTERRSGKWYECVCVSV